MLAFDIAQFFPSINHHLPSLTLDKAGFDPKVSSFFWNYLVGRKTKYLWNDLSSPSFNVDIGVGQGSALSPILSALYLSPIFEKQVKSLKIPISILSFVDNGLLIAQDRSMIVSNVNLFCSYNVISKLLTKFGLTMEHGKTDVFHFSRSHGCFDPPSLDLTSLGGNCLMPQDHLALPRISIQSQTIVSSTYWLLYQQGHLNNQMHENARKFIERPWSYSKETSLQMLHPTYSPIWLSIMALQQSATCISTWKT